MISFVTKKKMEYSAKAIAEYLKGTIEGNPDIKINTISKIEEGKEGTLSFLANPKYLKYIYTTKSSIVLVNKDFVLEEKVECTLIRVDDAYHAFASLMNLYVQSFPQKKGIDKKSSISKSAKMGKNIYLGAYSVIDDNAIVGNNVKIYPQVYVGDNAVIGDNTTLYPGVKIYKDCSIGKNCTIHSGTIIGSDGFGFAPSSENIYQKIPQIGTVIIEDDVEIGANVTIDRATMGSTIIRKGVKIDNLIQIAHNVEVGENTVMAAQSGIAGSTKVGKDCIIAAQAGIIGHLTIANKVIIGAQSGVVNNINQEKAIVLGSPAYNFNDKKREIAVSKQLPALYKKIYEMEKKLAELGKSKK